ncbi:MAG: FAD-dependent oxidoreductase [Candidatus Saccharimonadales bacterium]
MKLLKKYRELGDIWSFIFEPIEPLAWLAGQYINITMPDVPPVDQDRLFTIASAPHERTLLVTTYLGPSRYKQQMAQLQVGEVVEADQLGGDFIWQDDGRKKLYIAGGIGVTTFRSIILDQIDKKIPNDALLLYAGTQVRRPFMDELLSALSADRSLTMNIYDQERLTLAKLLADVPDIFERTVYLAGSQSFSETLGEGLIKQGINRQQIKYDYFDGYTDIEYQ